MNKSRILKYLVIYYGIVQTLHLILNIFPLFVDSYYYAGIVSNNLTAEGRNLLLVSSLIDFLVSSPFGIIFSYRWLKGKKNAKYFAFISFLGAGVSAIYYEYILLKAGAWELTPINIIFHLMFIPVGLLIFLLLEENKN